MQGGRSGTAAGEPASKSRPEIRPACASDAEALFRVAEQTFRATFAGLNTAEDMALHCRRSFGAAIQAREIADPDMLTLLAEENEMLIGFAQLRWGEAPACVTGESPREIQRLYVVAARHGRGVAQSLMDACIETMRQRGSDVIWLGVWERNPRAIAFYRKIGFIEVGEHVFALGNDPQRDIVMARTVVL